MTPFNLRIERKRGDTEELIINLKTNKKPRDITNCSFTLSVSKEQSPINNSSQLFQLQAIIVDANKGTIMFEFDETNTNYIGQYFFDIEMKKPNGKTRTISEGYFIFTQDITK